MLSLSGVTICGSFNSYEECLHFWALKKKNFETLPIFVAWGLWNMHNKVIFVGNSRNMFHIVAKVVAFFGEYPIRDKSK